MCWFFSSFSLPSNYFLLQILFVKLINIHGRRGDTSLKKECNCRPVLQTHKQSLSPNLKSQISNLKWYEF